MDTKDKVSSFFLKVCNAILQEKQPMFCVFFTNSLSLPFYILFTCSISFPKSGNNLPPNTKKSARLCLRSSAKFSSFIMFIAFILETAKLELVFSRCRHNHYIPFQNADTDRFSCWDPLRIIKFVLQKASSPKKKSWKSEWMENILNNIHEIVHLHLGDGFPAFCKGAIKWGFLKCRFKWRFLLLITS